MKEEKLNTGEISIQSNKFLAWLDNFWYHYKWHTIVTAFIVIVLSVCVVQACTSQKNDVIFTYAGPKEFVTKPEEKIALNSALSNVTRKVYGNDANAILQSFLIYSDKQIDDIEKNNYISESEKYEFPTADNMREKDAFDKFLISGASYIYLLDPSIYNELITKNEKNQIFAKLSDIYGTTPEGALDDYAVKLGDTEIYKTVPEFAVLPADTVICMQSPREYLPNQKEYKMQMDVFKDFATISTTADEESQQSK